MSTADKIRATCDSIRDLLLAKNEAYGDSALDPVRIFSKVDRVEGLKVRIDDKLSRLARGAAAGEDVIDDLIGYLVMLKIATRRPVVADSFPGAVGEHANWLTSTCKRGEACQGCGEPDCKPRCKHGADKDACADCRLGGEIA